MIVTRSSALLACLLALPTLLGVLPGLVTGPDPAAVVGAVLALTVAAVAVAAVAVSVADPAARAVVGISGRQAREQGRRGAFRRQTAPTTDGRPRPRAPGRA
ncbi:DUF6412 domain-containing protein [Actinomycetospora endophytica]|uniref:DUF6412 domain-containing protein n=1 Tax=Actinomycetospora endophytica TaxID=2291215 RepID=A0ABS8PB13_9PSEU|nr:DUF6412 domain-containing protein [Actinomycetospora endophytica]MCD2195458.1 DUF6412 domain-containing protein [Actinomycetospora endophytica]